MMARLIDIDIDIDLTAAERAPIISILGAGGGVIYRC